MKTSPHADLSISEKDPEDTFHMTDISQSIQIRNIRNVLTFAGLQIEVNQFSVFHRSAQYVFWVLEVMYVMI